MLLPAFAGHGDPHHPLVARVLCEHVAIRHQADTLAGDQAPTPAALHVLGAALSDHVRLEERELFGLIERTLPATQLAAVAIALEQAEGTSADG